MNSKFRYLIAGAGCALGLTLAMGQAQPPAAPAQAEPVSAPPGAGYVWMGGQWTSVDGQWKWVDAHWEQPPSTSSTWVPGHWAPEGGKWAWVNGAWTVQNSAQAQSGPPQPPSMPNQELYSVPTPTTPAPGQQTVVTEYGPDYDSSYAGTYDYDYPYWGWGYPGYWGYPGFAVDLGFGRGFYGRGFYGRGFRGRGNFGHGNFAGRAGGSGHSGARASSFGGHGGSFHH